MAGLNYRASLPDGVLKSRAKVIAPSLNAFDYDIKRKDLPLDKGINHYLRMYVGFILEQLVRLSSTANEIDKSTSRPAEKTA